jgi:uncharacterized membrane protein
MRIDVCLARDYGRGVCKSPFTPPACSLSRFSITYRVTHIDRYTKRISACGSKQRMRLRKSTSHCKCKARTVVLQSPILNRSSLVPHPDPCPHRLHFPRLAAALRNRLETMLPRLTTTAAVAAHHNHYHHKSAHAATMANFAPYQDIPESTRVMSPLTSPRASLDRTRTTIISPPTRTYEQHDYFGADNDVPSTYDAERAAPSHTTPFSRRSREDVDMFTTSLGWRLDYEAMLAYLLLPPAGGVFLLVMEHQSDYVRFHAWQSSLLFAFVFVIHVIFSWSSFISWVLFVGDVGTIGYLTWRAYLDGMYRSKRRWGFDMDEG